MDEELTLVRNVMAWLWSHHGEPWRKLPGDSPGNRRYNELVNVYPPISNDRELGSLLPSATKRRADFASSGKYFYLGPPEKGDAVLPLFSALFDFEKSPPEARVQMALFSLNSAAPLAMGFRFEGPEGAGMHSYYHAQPFNRFMRGPSLPGSPEWLATSTPTFPVDADCTVTLLIAMIISVYGFGVVHEIKSRVWSTVRERLERMSAVRVQRS